PLASSRGPPRATRPTRPAGAPGRLLRVAPRRALAGVWPIKLVFWLTVPGMMVLIAAMYSAATTIMALAAAVTTLGLLVYAVLLADNLRRAGSLPIVAAYG